MCSVRNDGLGRRYADLLDQVMFVRGVRSLYYPYIELSALAL
jgi:hypothetical protein